MTEIVNVINSCHLTVAFPRQLLTVLHHPAVTSMLSLEVMSPGGNPSMLLLLRQISGESVLAGHSGNGCKQL